MSIGRYSIKIYPGKRYLRRITQLTEEYSETEREIDVGQHGRLLITEIVTWGYPLNDYSWRYGRLFMRDSSDDSIIARFTEDNLRLLNKRTAGTVILDMPADETTTLDFNRGYYDLELVQASYAASASYGASCALDVADVTPTQPDVLKAANHNAGTTAINTNTGHVTWTDPSYVGLDDSNRATAELNNQYTDELDITNFNFDFGMNTTIVGIKVSIKRSENDAPAGAIKDYTVQLLKNGTAVGDNNADTSTEWDEEASEASVDYGASDAVPAELWGTTWTAHDICNHKFGVRVQAREVDSAAATAQINHVTITIYFEGTGKITAASGTPFNGWAAEDLIHIDSSENANEGIYEIWSVTDTVIVLKSPLLGTDNADDETIVISKVTLDEGDVVGLIYGSVSLGASEATY